MRPPPCLVRLARRRPWRRQLNRSAGWRRSRCDRRLVATRNESLSSESNRPLPFTKRLLVPAELERHLSSRWWESNPTTPAWRADVSPQHFTCLVVSGKRPRFRRHLGAAGTSDVSFVGRVGIEPTFFGVRDRCNNQLLLPTRSVPPSGIEPEPLGLQPSAQTNYARVGWMSLVLAPGCTAMSLELAPGWTVMSSSSRPMRHRDVRSSISLVTNIVTPLASSQPASGICSWVPAEAPASSSTLRFSESAALAVRRAQLGRLRPTARAGRTSGDSGSWRAQDAPRASMHSRLSRMHLSRTHDLDFRSRVTITGLRSDDRLG